MRATVAVLFFCGARASGGFATVMSDSGVWEGEGVGECEAGGSSSGRVSD